MQTDIESTVKTTPTMASKDIETPKVEKAKARRSSITQPKKESPNPLEAVFGEGYNVTEVRFTIFAAILIAINNGFVNGVTMSGLLSPYETTDLNPESAMVSGVAGYITNTASLLIGKNNWEKYQFQIFMFLSYMAGSFITAVLSPRAKPYNIDPMFGPSFLLGGTMLLGSSLLAAFEQPTRGIYYLAMAANGVQNGVASIYSANLIRCTLTGATTDIGLIFGQMLRGNFDKLGRGLVLGMIVSCFWIGGLIAYNAVRAFKSYTLLINAGIFYLVGILNVAYLIVNLNLSFTEALSGNWDWHDVLNSIKPSGDKQDLLDLFETLDDDDDGTLDLWELEKGLEGKVTERELKTLLVAADEDDSGDISKEEWVNLVEQLFIVDEDAT
jgi:hypothetical protein